MVAKRERILIINHATKQYTLFRVIAEQTAPIQHESVLPQVEAFHVHHGSIVLHQIVPSETAEQPQRPAPKFAAGPANPPKAAPVKRRGRPPGKKRSKPAAKPKKPRKLTPDQSLLLERALDNHQQGADGMPEKALNVRVANNLIRMGLLEAFTPDGMFMSWYRITKAGIERARTIEETWL